MTRAGLRACLLSCLLALCGSSPVSAQPTPDEVEDKDPNRFDDTRWSLVDPDGYAEGGCATGYMTFQLKSNHWFIFNNRVSGSWSVDNQGNIRLRTRDWLSAILVVAGKQLQVSSKVPFARKTQVFQRCAD